MTRATAARRPAVDLSARPNSPAKGSQFKKHGARNLHELDVSAAEFAVVDLGAPSLAASMRDGRAFCMRDDAAAIERSVRLDRCN